MSLLQSINPTTGEKISAHEAWQAPELDGVLAQTSNVAPRWADMPIAERCELLRQAAKLLRERNEKFARLITLEMGKLLKESEAEIEKCAWVCEYYAEHAPRFLADETIASDAHKSLIAYQPLGTLLAIMPWNFPFWQLFRCAAPALAAGNTVLLKHASNVAECALAIEQLMVDSDFPAHVFRTLLISSAEIEQIIADPRVHAVSLTGSEAAGRSVAALAGRHLKKTVLELGGSDPFVVLDDAELTSTAEAAVKSRFLNSGQSCIAAKRFIVVEDIGDLFLERFKSGIESLKPGDPLDPTTTLAPICREDLRQQLHSQVKSSVAKGAKIVTGGQPLEGRGYFYAPTLLDWVSPGMPAYEEELFGPVAAMIRARDEDDALRIANDSKYGLGGSVWTTDRARGKNFARKLACGSAFVNGIVKSDPRLPFGGIKSSGYGRELSLLGIREFVNAKTVWIK
ncbi:MAG: NAD-dependent succinate-semialdehyde dehydrogenase [Gammaproteobacteria bacterium]|jgi:succinate-semialdehyde dehydrogenase/glutarate-semialdehyde dehydrogenase